MMRQAGRYLEEYRAVRAKHGFLEVCKTPALAAEVTLQPVRRFDFDAAIIFSDILIPLEAMGAEVTFEGGRGPEIANPVRTADDVERLRPLEPMVHTEFVLEAINRVRGELAGRIPLIGFAGAPFTLACYLVEGGGSKEWRQTRRWLARDPIGFRGLLDRLADGVGDYLAAQVAAGADVVQLFDTWAGQLSPETYREVVLPTTQRAILRFAHATRGAGRTPLVLYVNGCAGLLEAMAATGADALGVDWRIGLDEARRRVGDRVALQGNLDPAALYMPPEEIGRAVWRVIEDYGPGPGHAFNLGHGVLRDTPVEGVQAMVEAVAAASGKGSS